MPRLRGGWVYDRSCGAILDLMIGPTDAPGELTVEQLEVAWAVERDGIMEDCRRNPTPGWRPWGWWEFSMREPQPEGAAAEALRLLELGEMDTAEVAAVKRRALGVLQGVEAANRAENMGAITTGPQDAARSMRARRDSDARKWRRVAEALGVA